jgi:CO/xanthine dehydrogenase FAD-binding subunit
MRVLRPAGAAEALELFGQTAGALPLAGGTDLMVEWNAGRLNRRVILDLSAVREWCGIRKRGRELHIGALATHTRIQGHPLVRASLPLLAAACGTVGGVQIQNRGTLGGNIANASPAGDTLPALAVYEAVIDVAAAGGRRQIPLGAMFTGAKQTSLRDDELIEAVRLPLPSPRPTRAVFRKVGTRAAQAISKTVVAGLLWLRRDGSIRELRFALGSMAPTVRRLTSVERYVLGRRPTPATIREACARLEDDVAPIDDIRSTAEYRLTVSRNLLAAFLRGSSSS